MTDIREAERQLLLERWERYRQTSNAIDEDTAETWLQSLAWGDVAPCSRGD